MFGFGFGLKKLLASCWAEFDMETEAAKTPPMSLEAAALVPWKREAVMEGRARCRFRPRFCENMVLLKNLDGGDEVLVIGEVGECTRLKSQDLHDPIK